MRVIAMSPSIQFNLKIIQAMMESTQKIGFQFEFFQGKMNTE